LSIDSPAANRYFDIIQAMIQGSYIDILLIQNYILGSAGFRKFKSIL